MATPPAPEQRTLKSFLPKTAMGLAMLLFAMSIASAFSGAILYAYYEYRLGKTDDRVDAFEAGFGEAVDDAIAEIDQERDDAIGQVQTQLDDLEKFAASGETLSQIVEKTQASVWFVQTLDEAGAPSVGSAFVVFSDTEQSFLLTSYATVRAATVKPAPQVTVRKGEETLTATLASWDRAQRPRAAQHRQAEPRGAAVGRHRPALSIGDRVFAESGLGAAGGSISQGFVAGVSAEGIQHDAPVGASFQGGPLLNSSGEVLGLAKPALLAARLRPAGGVPRGADPQLVRQGDPLPRWAGPAGLIARDGASRTAGRHPAPSWWWSPPARSSWSGRRAPAGPAPPRTSVPSASVGDCFDPGSKPRRCRRFAASGTASIGAGSGELGDRHAPQRLLHEGLPAGGRGGCRR